jgi:putative acyl-CoA dehydrogenase
MSALDVRPTRDDSQSVDSLDTHRVENQAPPLEDYNAFETDAALKEALLREGGDWGLERVRKFGALVGSARVIALGFQANRNPPVLRTHDRFGRRIDEVDFHPAWHELLAIGVENEVHALPWRTPKPGAHVVRAALGFLSYQQEAGVGCPLTMTFAAVPTLCKQCEIAAEWLPRITSNTYDPRFLPAEQKRGALIGMAMTEKQGGSDVRANTTQAHAVGEGVLLGPDERRLPDTRANGARPLVFPRAALVSRRHAEPIRHSATQGQTR